MTAVTSINVRRNLLRVLGSKGVVVGVMKMGNIVSRVGIEPTSLAFWAIVLPLHHVGSMMLPRLLVYAALFLRDQCRPLHLSP